MRQRAWFWDPTDRPRYLRIEPMPGEGGFWIGEIEFIVAERTTRESTTAGSLPRTSP